MSHIRGRRAYLKATCFNLIKVPVGLAPPHKKREASRGHEERLSCPGLSQTHCRSDAPKEAGISRTVTLMPVIAMRLGLERHWQRCPMQRHNMAKPKGV